MIDRFRPTPRLRCDAILCTRVETFPAGTSTSAINEWADDNGWKTYQRCGEDRFHCSLCAAKNVWKREAA